MRKVPNRKIMRSLCRTHRTKDGNVHWSKVALELLKLKTYQEALKKERETNELRKRTTSNH